MVEIANEDDYIVAMVFRVNIQAFMCVVSTTFNLQNKVKMKGIFALLVSTF